MGTSTGDGDRSSRGSDDEVGALRAEVACLRSREDGLLARVRDAEDALRASRSLHTATIEGLPFDFWARDREGYCISQNSAARAKWGDLLNKRPEEMELPEGVLDVWLANNQRALAGEVVRGEQPYEVEGEMRVFHNILAPIRRGDAVVGTLGVNIDITETRRAEAERATAIEALRESEQKLRMAAEAAGIGLWSWDTATDEVVWEAQTCAIFGVSVGAFPKGRDGFLSLVHPDDRAMVAADIARGIPLGGWEDEYRVLRSDGALRWILAKGTVLDRGGRTIVLGAVLDVTERRTRDEQLRQAQKLEAVGQLTAGIAHNFNNMLMGVLPNLEIAARKSPPELAPILRSAEHSARRAAELVRQLMTYSGRQRPYQPRVESMGALVERAVALCRTTFDQRIVFQEAYDPEARARVDATQIEQALLNVLINARDAMEGREAPVVTVRVDLVRGGAPELERHAGEHVRVQVGDNGAGMDAGTMARIYEPFFTTKEVGRGTGLGLATAQAIFREHGGWITCTSTAGRGTTFAMYLESAMSDETQSAPGVTPSRATGTETVLIVDDEAPIRTVVALMLGSAGFKTRAAASGAEAIALLSDPRVAAEVALVLLDVSMPGMPGRELRRRVGELAPHTRVVYFTGYAYEADDANDAVLEKPVGEEQLLSTIREVLDRGARTGE